jgi:hypothetical protein
MWLLLVVIIVIFTNPISHLKVSGSGPPLIVIQAWDTTWALFARDSSCNFTWGGDIGKILAWHHVLTSTDRTTAFNYLKTRWGL